MITFKQYLYLIEGKLEDYKAKNPQIDTSHDQNAKLKNSSDIIDYFNKNVPGGNLQYTIWLVDQYNKTNFKQEDIPDLKETLLYFEKYKSKLTKKQIAQYKSIGELKTSLHPFTSEDQKAQDINQKAIDRGSTLVYSSPKIDVYHVHTKEAARALGTCPKGKKLGWCTSHPDDAENMFDYYNKESGRNFHILHLHDEQFPYRRIGGVGAEKEFQDEVNDNINGKRLADLVSRNPELKKIKVVTDSYNFAMMELWLNPGEETINKLLDNPDENIRIKAASNHSATEKNIDKALNDISTDVRRSAILNRNVTEKNINKALNDNKAYIRKLASEHDNATKEHVDKYNHNEKNIKKAYETSMEIAKNHNSSKEQIDRLLNDFDDAHRLHDYATRDIRQEVAKNPNLSKDQIDKLLNDRDRYIRQEVAKNPNLSKDQFDKLLNDEDEDVRKAVAESPNLSKDRIDKLLNNEDVYLRKLVAENPNLTKEQLDKLLNDEAARVRASVATNKNLSKDQLDKALNDKEIHVRSYAATNKNLSKDQLDKALNDKATDVRKSAAANPKLTREQLIKALNDVEMDVRFWAQLNPNY